MTRKKKPEPTDTKKLTDAQIVAMVKENRWWPFTRVPVKILPRMHRSIVAGNPMTEEEALL